MFDFDFLNHEKTTFCVLRFFSYSFTASDGSQEFTAGRVVSPCSIMMHHGYRSKEARRARKQKYILRQTTSHSSLLVDRQGDVSRKLNQAFLLVDSFNFNFVDDERTDILSPPTPPTPPPPLSSHLISFLPSYRTNACNYISIYTNIIILFIITYYQQYDMGWGKVFPYFSPQHLYMNSLFVAANIHIKFK